MFSCTNICRVPKNCLNKSFQKYFSRDTANVNAMKQICIVAIFAFYNMIPLKKPEKPEKKSFIV